MREHRATYPDHFALGEEVSDMKSNRISVDEDWDLIEVICGALAESTKTTDQAPFIPDARNVIDALVKAGYTVVKRPEPRMETRPLPSQPVPTWRHEPSWSASPLAVQVQKVDGAYEVASVSGVYTPDEAIGRGAVWVAAGVEAKRLQGGEPR